MYWKITKRIKKPPGVTEHINKQKKTLDATKAMINLLVKSGGDDLDIERFFKNEADLNSCEATFPTPAFVELVLEKSFHYTLPSA